MEDASQEKETVRPLRKMMCIDGADEDEHRHHPEKVQHKRRKDPPFDRNRPQTKLGIQFLMQRGFLDLHPDVNEKEDDKRLCKEIHNGC